MSRLVEVPIKGALVPRSFVGARSFSSLNFISRLFGAHITPPKPKKVPSFQTVHGVELRDDFSWLKNRGSRVSERASNKLKSRYSYRLTHSASELSGYTCTSSLTMNEKFHY